MDDPATALKRDLDSALTKLKASMDDGPGGADAVLTPAESCLVYRVLNERLGLRAPE